ncbi:MAG: glycerophosphodiester phosphodiesterase family protein [Robiginitomaculum sp.]
MRKKIFIILSLCIAIIWIINTSLFTKPSGVPAKLWAHRGVHQTYSADGVTNQTCTAAIIDRPSHSFIENTLPSLREAVRLGADMLELDIHPTRDGDFIVFHDWTLDCRTDGTGKTRNHTLAELKALDAGYGYTADGGKTYPFRGKFIGAMPSLEEALTVTGDKIVFINIKSRSREEARLLASYLKALGLDNMDRLVIYGHPAPIAELESINANFKTFTKAQGKACVKSYILTGWTGRMPKACENTFIGVPSNYRRLMWGWPHKLSARAEAAGSQILLIGELKKGSATQTIDSATGYANIPKGFDGIIATNKIGVIGPLARGARQ